MHSAHRARGAQLVNLRHFEQVRAIVRAGGISGAARQLGLSQSALSRSLSSLEAEIGAPLFDRSSGAAVPTAYGLFLAERADHLLAAVDATLLEIGQWTRGATGRLRIGVGPVTSARPLKQLLPWMAETLPDLSFEIRQRTGPELVSAVADGRLDMAFTHAGIVAQHSNLRRINIYDRPVAHVVRKGHPLEGRGRCTPQQLLRYPIATCAPLTFRGWAGPMTEAESRNAAGFICDDVQRVVEWCASTSSVGHGPDFVFEEQIASGCLVEIPVERPYRFECWLLATPSFSKSPLTQLIAEKARKLSAD